MVRIVLNESQILAMKAEIKEMEKAEREHELGVLFFQIFPNTQTMEGRFVPNDIAIKIIEVLYFLEGRRIFR
jgi:hypothetical protein